MGPPGFEPGTFSTSRKRYTGLNHGPTARRRKPVFYIFLVKFLYLACFSVIMDIKSYLGKNVEVTVDRKLGSKHPEYGYIYPINYGFLKGTVSGDGKEIDAFIIGINNPLDTFRGACIAIVLRLDDDDPKLIVAPKGKKYTQEEIEKQIEFQEKYFTHKLIM